LTTLFNYKTPKKFAAAFHAQYATDNLKQVQMLSALFLFIAIVFRTSYIVFDSGKHILNYTTYSNINWIQLSGTLFFFTTSILILKYLPKKQYLKKVITLLFVAFVLAVTLSVSYTFSMHNTKNNLMMYLIGIVTVSLFFSLELIEILIITFFITGAYCFSIFNAPINVNDKIMNLFAGFILGFILYSFSRYSYYFKSQHFVRLKQLEEKNLQVERLLIQQGEILGFVAHDLRNPLHNIEALSRMLDEEAPKEELKLIMVSTDKAKSIINDLIVAVKTDKTELDTHPENLNTFLQVVTHKWKTNSTRNFRLNLTEEEIYAPVNAYKMERVLDNLISNAIKFSPDEKDIVISLSKTADEIRISVNDEGIGIPENLIPFIFQQFSQAGRTGLKGEKSLGLGLHISKKIMQQHGGELFVESKESNGTTFTIQLPLRTG